MSGTLKRNALLLAAMGIAMLSECGSMPAYSQAAWKPEKTVEFIVESSPGAGVDRTARLIQKILQDGAQMRAPIVVVNKPGGGGNVAYQYLARFAGDGHYLAMATATLLTNHVLGVSDLNYTDFTPVSMLYGEYIGFAVKTDGPIGTGKDLIERMKRDPESVNFAFGTSLGNANHIGIAAALKAGGVDPRRANIVPFKASIDATMALMGGHVDVVATPVSTFAPVMGSGKIRIIAVAAPHRTGGQFAQVPTWKEQGYDVVAASYRMILGPRKLTPAQLAFWDDALGRLSRSEAWKSELAANGWEDLYMSSAESVKYLDAKYAQYRALLVELGLAK